MRDIILIPRKYFDIKKNRRKKAQGIFLMILCVVAAAALIIFPYKICADLEAEKSAINNKNKALAETYLEGQQYDAVNLQYKDREDLAKQMESGGIDMPKLLGRIEVNAPGGIYLAGLSATESTDKVVSVSINGTAGSRNDISTLISNLEKDGYFSKVTLEAATARDSAMQGQPGFVFMIGMKIQGTGVKP